jgi:uncharacterized protein YcbK (DUF882 family)
MGAQEKRGWTAPPGSVVARRAFLTGTLGLLGLAVTSHPVLASVVGLAERRITLRRAHFGESFSGIYWQDGQYVPEALSEVSQLFREPKHGAVRQIDPQLLDGLMVLQRKMGSAESFDLLSGFRAPKAGESPEHAARTSYHHVGKAADIRLANRTPQQIFDAARQLQIGGVGRYAGKNLVHVDTGAFRTWAWGYGNRGHRVTMGGDSSAAEAAPAPTPQSPAPQSPMQLAVQSRPPMTKPALLRAAPPAPLPRPR